MEVHLTPVLAAELDRLAKQTGRTESGLVQEAVAGYFAELSQSREMLDRRYDDIKSSKVKPIDSEEAIERLRQKSQARRSNRP
jgi:predicted transcriptional regulator